MAKPFASKAQLERCRKLVEEGKVTQASFDEHPELLPERLHPKKEKKDKPEPEDAS